MYVKKWRSRQNQKSDVQMCRYANVQIANEKWVENFNEKYFFEIDD